MPRKTDFDSLVSNALDFMRRAIADIQTRPKESVINFWNAVELFFKARLMEEHWALIVDRVGDADLRKFKAGDFVSVGMKDVIRRLESIAGETFSSDEKNCLDKLREHRNRLVHFFDPAYGGKPNKAIVQRVIAEQCRGWFYLFQRLSAKWQTHFAKHKADIRKLNVEMHKLRAFLMVKFGALTQQIKKEKMAGAIFMVCESCGFEAAKEEEVLGPKMAARCLVCEQCSEYLNVNCPACNAVVHCRDGKGRCKCGEKIGLAYLFGVFGAIRDIKDELIEPSHAYCCECHMCEHRTVVPIEGAWLCLQCLTEHSDPDHCEWCSEFVTGDLEDSYLKGCMMCEGRFGWDDGD